MQLSEKEIIDILSRLDNECWSCMHSNPVAIPDEKHGCGICYGKKYILTDAGQALIDFLERQEVVVAKMA